MGQELRGEEWDKGSRVCGMFKEGALLPIEQSL
jgi:hypothetical protein